MLAAADISAYCAAVKRRLHSAEKYATTTTPPKPLAKFSKPIAAAMPQLLWPAAASSAKPRFETPISTRRSAPSASCRGACRPGRR